MRSGLLGRKLSHSYSPQIHSYLGDYTYPLYEVEPDNVGQFLQKTDFTGINVTIPYKKTVIPYCSELSETARRLSAVNTIVKKPNGQLIGHNTDYFGFLCMVNMSGLQVSSKKVLVLGSGGASNTAVAVMQELGAHVVIISRTGDNNYSNIAQHADARVIVNATPVGMYPNNGFTPVNLNDFPYLEGVLDMIYNPARTQLLLDAEAKGLVAENGLWMLIAQAKESFEWFAGKEISDKIIETIHEALSIQMQNIILIGMPGCGKSTVGKALADEYNRKFVDVDTQIEKIAGCSIPEIFKKFGEEGFRKLETQVLADIAKESGCVISTGGGCVTRPENYPLLHQNGKIIWLQRDLDLLPTEGRPLSQVTKLQDMYRNRQPLYSSFADHSVDNNGSIDTTLETIRRLL